MFATDRVLLDFVCVGIPDLRPQPLGGKKPCVFDPFRGRVTSIVDARIKRHEASGVDCTPIAVAIAPRKSCGETENEVAA